MTPKQVPQQYCNKVASDFSMYTITVQMTTRYMTDTNCTLVQVGKLKKGHITHEKTVKQLTSPSSVTNPFRRFRAGRYITELPVPP